MRFISDVTRSGHQAAAAVAAAVVHLADVDLTPMDGDQLLDLARTVQTIAHRLDTVAVAVAGRLTDQCDAAQGRTSSTAALLRDVLNISAATAHGRVRSAEQTQRRTSLTGEQLDPHLPLLAAAMAGGLVSGEHAAVVCATMSRLHKSVGAEGRELCEKVLVEQATMCDPVVLRKVARQILAMADPDGSLDDQRARDSMELHIGRRKDNGLTHIWGELDDATIEMLHDVLGPLARPRHQRAADEDGDAPGPSRNEEDEAAPAEDLTEADSPDEPDDLDQAEDPYEADSPDEPDDLDQAEVPDGANSPDEVDDLDQAESSRRAGRTGQAGTDDGANDPGRPDQHKSGEGTDGSCNDSTSCNAGSSCGSHDASPDNTRPHDDSTNWSHGLPAEPPPNRPALEQPPNAPSDWSFDDPPGSGVPDSVDGYGRPAWSDPSDPVEEALRDTRTAPLRRAQALGEALQFVLTAGVLPAHGGERPHVTVTIDHRDLAERVGAAVLGNGALLAAGTARRLACDAKILPLVLGGESRVLDVGRARYTFPPHLRAAITARDRGCAWPGCDRPPTWTDCHHIQWWSRDMGPTSYENGCLLCQGHHIEAHRDEWTIRTGTDGRPEFVPPSWIDPERTPRRNTANHLIPRDLFRR